MATNLPPKKTNNETKEFFDVYNTTRAETVVSSTDHDAVRGFFMRKTNDNIDVSNGLTDTVMQISSLHGAKPMELIDEFNDYAVTDIQQALVSLLNQQRANTSILGFNRNKKPSTYTARNILV